MLIETGAIFWFESEGIGQEEQGSHPWIVISSSTFLRRNALVLAVPCTSGVTEYMFDVSVPTSDIRPWPHVKRPLKQVSSCVAKPRKIRHISIDRITEIVGMITNKDIIRAIQAEVMTAMKM